MALYFPDALRGFSIAADREQMAGLPDCLYLAGGFEPLCGVIMWPRALLFSESCPVIDMAAVQLRTADRSVSLWLRVVSQRRDRQWADYYLARLGRSCDENQARGHFSGGLVYCPE